MFQRCSLLDIQKKLAKMWETQPSTNKTGVNLTKNDLVASHRLTNSDLTIKKVLERKHAEQIMNNQVTTKMTGPL